MFRALALRRSHWRIWGLCEDLYAENGATPLMRIWWRENQNKWVEWKPLVGNVGIKSADLENKFSVQEFCGFSNCPDVGKGRKLPYAALND